MLNLKKDADIYKIRSHYIMGRAYLRMKLMQRKQELRNEETRKETKY